MGRNLQVLIIDADLDHRSQIKATLSGLPYAVVGDASYGVEASRLAVELQPDIILIHIEEPLALALRTLDVVQQAAPQAAPVAISRRDDVTTIRKTMLAGARGYVMSPPVAEDMDETLQKAYQVHQRVLHPEVIEREVQTAGVVITVFGPKGGVGKTTLSTNLAIALRRRTSARVALFDMDPHFGDVAVMMGAEPERTLADLVQALRGNPDASVQDFLTLHSSGVAILPAPHALDADGQPSTEDAVSIINALAASFDFVVIDTPGAFSPLVASALDESTVLLMVTSADMASIKDIRLSLDVLRGAGFDVDRLKLVVNHATNANSVSQADLARTVDYEVFWDIPHDRAVPTSTQHGVPIMIANPKTPMAQQVDALAAHLCQGPAKSTGRRLPRLLSAGGRR